MSTRHMIVSPFETFLFPSLSLAPLGNVLLINNLCFSTGHIFIVLTYHLDVGDRQPFLYVSSKTGG